MVFLNLEKLLFRFKKKTHVLYVAKNKLMFNNIIDIHQAMKADPLLVNIVCFAKPNLFSEDEITNLKQAYQLKTIPYKWAKYLNWDLIVFPDHNPEFRETCKKVYINHGIFTGVQFHGQYYEFSGGARNTKNEIIYDKIFVSSEYLEIELQKRLPELNGIIKSVGNIFIDEIINSKENKKRVFQTLNFNNKLKTIMLVSTWGDNSLIQSQGEQLLKQVASLSEHYNIILSLHLNCYRKEHSEGKDWLELLQTCNRKNVFLVPPGGKIFDLFQYVDLYVADRTSLSLYFSIMQKPMVLFNNDKLILNDLSLMKKIRAIVPLIDNIDILSVKTINAYIANFNKSELHKLSEYTSSYQGESLTRHVNEIYDTLNLNVPVSISIKINRNEK